MDYYKLTKNVKLLPKYIRDNPNDNYLIWAQYRMCGCFSSYELQNVRTRIITKSKNQDILKYFKKERFLEIVDD